MLEKFPIRSAQHIVHYSLPQKLKTFKQRYITCYGFYEDRLRRKLLYQENELARPISHVYFDEQLTDEYIEVFELLLKRTQCQPPPLLIETVQVIEDKSDNSIRNKKLLWFNFPFNRISANAIQFRTQQNETGMQ